jgi:hypothetical protein
MNKKQLIEIGTGAQFSLFIWLQLQQHNIFCFQSTEQQN